MLQVMRQAGVVGRIVLPSHAEGDIRLDTGFVLVDRHIQLETVVQGVNLHLHRVSRHLFETGTGTEGSGSDRHQKEESFHSFVHLSELQKYTKNAYLCIL